VEADLLGFGDGVVEPDPEADERNLDASSPVCAGGHATVSGLTHPAFVSPAPSVKLSRLRPQGYRPKAPPIGTGFRGCPAAGITEIGEECLGGEFPRLSSPRPQEWGMGAMVILRHDLPDGSGHFDLMMQPAPGARLITFRVQVSLHAWIVAGVAADLDL